MELCFLPLLDNQAHQSCLFRNGFPEKLAAARWASKIWKSASIWALGTGIARDRVTIT